MDNANSFSASRLLSTLLVVGIVAAGAYFYGVKSVEPSREEKSVELFGLGDPVKNRLDDRFTDADGDLVADAPEDASQLLDPETLTFSYLATDQDRYREVWASYLTQISEQIGKPIEFVAFDSVESQLSALEAGELHIAGVNVGAAPLAVNVCGFVPLVSFGHQDSVAQYTMEIITRPDSKLSKPADLKGKTLVLTTSTSNSGWKAPLAILASEFNMKPVRDYDVIYSNGHSQSILGIASKEYEKDTVAAAVASDELALAKARGLVKSADYKSIYSSKPFCNNVIGVTYRLQPALAKKLNDALTSTSWQGTPLSDEFASMGATEFVEISFTEHLKLVRANDDSMGRRHSKDLLSRRVFTPEDGEDAQPEGDSQDAPAEETQG